jgi:GTP-binding protein EngB required for normal cell division
MNGRDALQSLARLAGEAGSSALALEAEALAERLAEGRFYVACVGQFKRGKSTLLNALVGEPVLPTGVVPITAAVTVIRYGEPVAARVRFGERDWEDCDPRNLATYVSEEQNPENEKGVTGVEVFVPHALLESGMCLVDTPGLGSISEANTAATRAFVPHIDAALVVLGADPPITGEELALVQEAARQVRELVFVFNKADRTSDHERAEAIRFAERVLGARLGRSVGAIFQVSALERVLGEGTPRDWEALTERLGSLARRSGADLVKAAEARGTVAVVEHLLRDLALQEAALLRPLGETEARVERLRRVVAEGERSLRELSHRLTAVQERLSTTFIDERQAFFSGALPEAQRELLELLAREYTRVRALRRRSIELATGAARHWLDRWRQEQEPHAEALYQQGVARFVELVNEFQEALRSAGLETLRRLDADTRFRARSGYYFTAMLRVAPDSGGSWMLDIVRRPGQRRRAVERDARAYLERLLEINSARITNDFRDRVMESPSPARAGTPRAPA